jgi:hypothetical protein
VSVGLRLGRQQAAHIVAAGSRKSTVKGDKATTMPSREPEKITVRDLFGGSRPANFGHRRRRYGVRPELVLAACSGEQQKSVGSCFGRPRTTWQLRTNANHSKLCHGAGRPAVGRACQEIIDLPAVRGAGWMV